MKNLGPLGISLALVCAVIGAELDAQYGDRPNLAALPMYCISQLTWFNRTRRVLGTVGEPDVYYDPTLAPDGATLAVEKRDGERGTTDLWTVDLARGVFSRLTDAPGFEDVAMWAVSFRQQRRPVE